MLRVVREKEGQGDPRRGPRGGQGWAGCIGEGGSAANTEGRVREAALDSTKSDAELSTRSQHDCFLSPEYNFINIPDTQNNKTCYTMTRVDDGVNTMSSNTLKCLKNTQDFKLLTRKVTLRLKSSLRDSAIIASSWKNLSKIFYSLYSTSFRKNIEL